MQPTPEYPRRAEPRSHADAAYAAGTLSAFSTIAAVLGQARLLIGVPLIAAVLAGGLAIVRGRQYSAESAFVPEAGEKETARFAGLAAQFGLSLGGLSEGKSPEFYASLAKSRELLREIARTRYRFPLDRAATQFREGSLLELYRIEAPTEEERLRAATHLLRKQISVGTDLKAGLVTVRTVAPWPELAVQLNRRLLDLVNEYNLKKRQSQAAAERRFVESRMGEAGKELERAEGELERFLEENRRYENSPELSFAAARLQSRVELRRQVYTSLAQAYEQARIDEVRNTPVLTIVDSPEGSADPVGSPIKRALIAFFLGTLVVLGFVFTKEYIAAHRAQHPEAHAQLQAMSRTALASMLPPALLVRLRMIRPDEPEAARRAVRGASRPANLTDSGEAGGSRQP